MNAGGTFRGRAANKPSAPWIYGDLRHYQGKEWIVNDEIRTENGNKPVKSPVYPESVGQALGITDAKGVPIYTGDVVSIFICNIVGDREYRAEQQCQLKYLPKKACIAANYSDDSWVPLYQILQSAETVTLTVVGNVFDKERDLDE